MKLRVVSMMIVFSVCIAVVSAFADRQTMIIWNIDTSYAQWFDDMYKPFEQQNNVDIKISTVPSEDFHVKFISAVQAKSQIDALTQIWTRRPLDGN